MEISVPSARNSEVSGLGERAGPLANQAAADRVGRVDRGFALFCPDGGEGLLGQLAEVRVDVAFGDLGEGRHGRCRLRTQLLQLPDGLQAIAHVGASQLTDALPDRAGFFFLAAADLVHGIDDLDQQLRVPGIFGHFLQCIEGGFGRRAHRTQGLGGFQLGAVVVAFQLRDQGREVRGGVRLRPVLLTTRLLRNVLLREIVFGHVLPAFSVE